MFAYDYGLAGVTPHDGEEVDSKAIFKILDKHAEARGALIAVLEDIQAQYGYLPQTALQAVSERLGCSLVDVYGVATFYGSFSLTPRGKHIICVCRGTACHVRGAPVVAEAFERELGIKAGQTTSDRKFTLETVNCLGACALGPVVVIDGRYFSKVKRRQVPQLIQAALDGSHASRPDNGARPFPIRARCSSCGHTLMDTHFVIDDYPSVRLSARLGEDTGWLRLSSVYGSLHSVAQHSIPANSVVRLLCPHCRAELRSAWTCPSCAAPMAQMSVDGGGMLRICSRRGCESHMLDLI
jgi:NADH:ubiquinone oxidoreductase subunit E